jgi:hypothetical protein
MKETCDTATVRVRRSGYEGSGFVFYFARCKDRKALAAYVARLPGGAKFKGEGAPYGYSYSRFTEALPDVMPESFNGGLWEAHMIVVAAGGKDKVTPAEERRIWHHEVGHVVESFAEAYEHNVLPSYMRLVADGKAAAVLKESPSEAPAYCNEFLCECVDLVLMGSDAEAKSGLPNVMPWCKAGGAK